MEASVSAANRKSAHCQQATRPQLQLGATHPPIGRTRPVASPQLQSTKVGMISLGCAKNLVDAEVMLGSVLQAGMEITSTPEKPDVLLVNTSPFIDSPNED